MIWIASILVVTALGSGALVYLLFARKEKLVHRTKHSFDSASAELTEREEVLRELARMSLGLVSPSAVNELRLQVEQLHETQRIEQGQCTIMSAEKEAMQGRLSNLTEIAKELESSNQVAEQELEMLKAQERSVAEKNSAVKAELDAALTQIDKLLLELASSKVAIERLSAVKGEMVEGQKKLDELNECVVMLNEKYATLKKAYDALDIEYAQLYERQSAAS